MSKSRKITVAVPASSYEVEIGTGLLSGVGARIDQLRNGAITSGKQRAFVVTSPSIWNLHGEALASSFPVPPTVLQVPAGEQHKRLAAVERLAEQMAEAGADRSSVLLAFGGGVLGDMTGFLASAYMRGIPYIQIPTTLLAQVDSSLGGKTGVNLAAGKNLFGSFHHPLAVFADIDVLATLPSAELRAGLQESIKASIIRDRALFDLLDTRSADVLAGSQDALLDVISASVQVKAGVVSADERESGLRMILNLGHTLGHAIESATGYTQLLHGEAVAWGMIAAIEIAAKRGTITHEEALRMQRVIRDYGPLKTFKAQAAELVALTAKDKKNRGGLRSFVLPVGIGDATVVNDVTEAELMGVTQHLLELVASESPA